MRPVQSISRLIAEIVGHLLDASLVVLRSAMRKVFYAMINKELKMRSLKLGNEHGNEKDVMFII